MRIGRHIGIAVAMLALVASPLVLAALAHPTPIDWRHGRFDERHETLRLLAGRDEGRTEMEFLAQYEKLDTQATAFSQGYRQGRRMGRSVRDYQCEAIAEGRIAEAQSFANATGEPVGVIVC